MQKDNEVYKKYIDFAGKLCYNWDGNEKRRVCKSDTHHAEIQCRKGKLHMQHARGLIL